MDRMDNAYNLASKCWAKAYASHPAFVVEYFQLANNLLREKPLVRGEEFKDNCKQHGVRLPAKLHHNTWVSGVRALFLIGWIHPVKKVEPVKGHNHMSSVTLWRSNLYGDE
jgi:hypothetical protein